MEGGYQPGFTGRVLCAVPLLNVVHVHRGMDFVACALHSFHWANAGPAPLLLLRVDRPIPVGRLDSNPGGV